MRPDLIISGGQTGADQAALFAAEHLDIATGGWMPRGALTEEGPRPNLLFRFGLREHESALYAPRTRQNVRDADGTVWFGTLGSPGYFCTSLAAQKQRKPFERVTSSEQLRTFMHRYSIKTLNCAGNQASMNPGIYQFTYDLIVDAFQRPLF